MKFTNYDYKKLRRRSNLFKLITDFQKSCFKCAKLEEWEYVNADIGARSINNACKTYKILHVKAVVNDGEIFLVNELIRSDV